LNHSCLSFSIHDTTHFFTVLYTWENDISFCITIKLSLFMENSSWLYSISIFEWKRKKRKGKPTQLQWKIMNCSKHFMNLFAVKLGKTMVKNLHHDLDKLQYWPRWSFSGKKEMSGEQTVFFESLLDISNQVVHRPLLFMLNQKDYEFKTLIYSTQENQFNEFNLMKWQVTIKDRAVHSRVKPWLCLINLLVK